MPQRLPRAACVEGSSNRVRNGSVAGWWANSIMCNLSPEPVVWVVREQLDDEIHAVGCNVRDELGNARALLQCSREVLQ